MSRPRLLDDIAWWFTLNMIIAILIALAMSVVFVALAGHWANPPLENAGLIEEAGGIVRVMDQIAPAERPALAAKLGSPAFGVHWYRTRAEVPIATRAQAPIAISVDNNPYDPRLKELRELFGRPAAGVVAGSLDEAGWLPQKTPGERRYEYNLAIELSDHTWLGFGTDQHSWGLSHGIKGLLVALFILVSSGIIASFASRRLARPIQHFASAAEKFGTGALAEPLLPVGPREIRDAAAAFNVMQERIQQLMDSRTEMLTAISHDLRAPLTRMRLRGEFVEDSEQQWKLFRDVDDMQAMIEASLNFFRNEGREEEQARFDLIELLQTILDDFSDMNLSATLLDAPPKLFYNGRPRALKRALINLIDNAVKYGSRAAITVAAKNDRVFISIDDDGPGVAHAMIPRLFQPFFRGEPSRNKATGGFGLGLASALSIVRSHSGQLTLENRRPHGLRANVVLPIKAGIT